MIKLPKGTRDYDGDDYERLRVLKSIATKVFKTFQGEALITPTFERRDVLTNKYGDEEKLIFNLEGDKEDDDDSDTKSDTGELKKEFTSLRYDMTVPFVRYLIENGVKKMKRYSIGTVFRRETTSKKIKRLREFNQADFDFAGDYDTNLPEVQLFKMINLFFKLICKKNPDDRTSKINYTIRYNYRSLLYYYICKVANINESLFSGVCSSLDKLDKRSREYVTEEMLDRGVTPKQATVLFACIDKGEFPEGEEVTKINNDLKIKLEEYNITNTKFDPTLARGLDYYTGIIFEATVDGFDSSVGGGGRYDNLVKKYDPDLNIPIAGMSFGLDRLMQFVELWEKEEPTIVVFTIIQKTTEEDRIQLNKVKAKVIDMVIEKGYKVDFRFNDKKARKQMSKIAADPNYKYAIIIGMVELAENSVGIKNLATREQKLVPIDSIMEFI